MNCSVSRCRLFCRSTIGRKYIVAITGLLLCGFVLMHMTGNMLILYSPEAYNEYSYNLTHNPFFLYTIEVVLAAIFLFHINTALLLALDNQKARPVSPQRPQGCEKAASFASRSMVLTGVLTLVFLILHLITFRFGTYYKATHHGVVMRDLHRLVVEKFSDPLYFGWYLFSMAVLWLHLSHGASALFQTLGFASTRTRSLRVFAYSFASLIALGFASQPVYIFFGGGR